MKRRTLFLGPPGSGKGTLAKRLSSDFGIPHVATGDMLRNEVNEGTALGLRAKASMDAGGLVEDEIVLSMVALRLSQPDASRGWILDGFPRTIPQAQALDARLSPRGIDVVIRLEVPRGEIVDRICGRRVCSNGHVYHLKTKPPKQDGVCDVDGKTLIQRDDDRAEVILERLDVYDRETAPLIGHYTNKGDVTAIDGSGDPEVVYQRVVEVFRGLDQPT